MPACSFASFNIWQSTGEAIVSGLRRTGQRLDRVCLRRGSLRSRWIHRTKPTGSAIVQRTGLWTPTPPQGRYFYGGTIDEPSIEEVVDDTTPQLGGDLDVNGNKLSHRAMEILSLNPMVQVLSSLEATLMSMGIRSHRQAMWMWSLTPMAPARLFLRLTHTVPGCRCCNHLGSH